MLDSAAILDLIDRQEHRQAWGDLARSMMEAPTTATCHQVADAAVRVDAAAAGASTVRLAILSNYTAQPLAPVLQGHAVVSGLQLLVHVPAFETWMQELVGTDSALRRFDPDVVILDLVLETLCPRLVWDFLALSRTEVDEIVRLTGDRIESALQALRGWSTAKVLLHVFERPVAPTLGILDTAPGGQTHAIASLNARLQCLAARDGATWCVDVDRLVADVGYGKWRDQRLWLSARIPYSTTAMHRIANEHLRFVRAFTGRTRKWLALDLDDTLWGGVLGEVGADGLQLGPTYPGNAFLEVQAVVSDLHRRGVVLALNSANDAEQAIEVLNRHPSMLLRADRFAAVRINWSDKAENLVELSEELGLALSACVFVDNSDSECARVRHALPEVLTIHLDGDPATFASRLRQLGVFDSLSFSQEDRQRGGYYRSEVNRAALRKTASSIDDYLASLDTELHIEPVGRSTATRAADLTQRTNQFNMTTRRRTGEEILAYAAAPGREAYVFRLADRFGDQGIIGFATLEPAEPGAVRIADFLLSCRVLKRHVETEMLRFLVTRSRDRGAARIVGEVRPTKRNAPFTGFYESEGFQPTAREDGVQEYVAPITASTPVVTHIRSILRPAESASA